MRSPAELNGKKGKREGKSKRSQYTLEESSDSVVPGVVDKTRNQDPPSRSWVTHGSILLAGPNKPEQHLIEKPIRWGRGTIIQDKSHIAVAEKEEP